MLAVVLPSWQRFALISFGVSDLQRSHPELLTRGQKIGLEHFEDFQKRIPRQDIIQVEKILKREITAMDKNYQVTASILNPLKDPAPWNKTYPSLF